MTRGTDVSHLKRTYRTPHPGEFPDTLEMRLRKVQDLRYGENPNQTAALYLPCEEPCAALTTFRILQTGKGGMSATNFMDIARGMDLLKYFPDTAVAIMKHALPSGFSHGLEPQEILYEKARLADARSAFGSVVLSNMPVTPATAERITEKQNFVEVLAAPAYADGTLPLLASRKDLRVIEFSSLDRLPKFTGDDTSGLRDLKMLPTGHVIVQEPYLTGIRGPLDLVLDPLVMKEGTPYVVERNPTDTEMKDLLTAWYLAMGVRSNGIVAVKDGVSIAISAGQQERVGAVEQMIFKALMKGEDREDEDPLKGAVVASDGFFPFRDSIDILAEEGVTAIIQPGGSVKDYEVIQAVNEHQMAMAFTLERCFAHF